MFSSLRDRAKISFQSKKVKSVIYITQLPSRFDPLTERWSPTVDVTAAQLLGELRFMFPPGINVQDVTTAAEEMKAALANFNPEEDHFLPMADPVLMVLGAAQLGARFGRFSMLKWDRHARKYFPHVIETFQKGKSE